jgi:transcriptional regulator with PAS, ATPase and Fis domain
MDNKKEQDEFFEAFDEIWPVGEVVQESLPQELKVIEIKRIKLALEQEKNHTHAAKSLGIGRTNLLAKMKKYNLV